MMQKVLIRVNQKVLSVGPAKEEKKPAAPPAAATSSNNKSEAPTVPMQVWAYPMPPSYPVYEIKESEPNCSIM